MGVLGEASSQLERTAIFRRELMAESEWMEWLYLRSMEARTHLAATSPALEGLYFPGCWLEPLPESLKPVADRLLRGKRLLGDILCIQQAIIASDKELAAYEAALSSVNPNSLMWVLGPVVAERSVNTDMVLKRFGKVAASPESEPVFWLLLEFLWPFLDRIYQSALKYYGIDESGAGDTETRQALFGAVFTSTVTCSLVTYRRLAPVQAIPVGYFHFLLRTIKEQLLRMLGILGHVQARESGYADIGVDLAAIDDDAEFVEAFHGEWERQLQFEDGFYDFHVVPNAGWSEMDRYLGICYRGDNIQRKAKGYRREIAWEVMTFRIHQAKVAASMARVLSPQTADLEYRKAVNLALEPLVAATAGRVSSIKRRFEGSEGSAEKDLEAARLECRHVVDEAYDAFKFYFKAGDEDPFTRPYGLLRLSGEHTWRVPPLFHEQLEGSGPRLSKELPFIHHVESVLGRWASCETRKVYRYRENAVSDVEDAEVLARVQRQEEAAAAEWDGAVFEAPDGRKYITIVQLAGRLACPEHQLRRFDRELRVRRVSEVFGADRPSLGRIKLKGGTRLYELSDDLVHRAARLLSRIGDPLAGCKTRGMTRAEVCEKYSIAASTLQYWEKQGIVNPIRENGRVIYTEGQVDLVRRFARKPQVF